MKRQVKNEIEWEKKKKTKQKTTTTTKRNERNRRRELCTKPKNVAIPLL